jgi:hypothetical protein
MSDVILNWYASLTPEAQKVVLAKALGASAVSQKYTKYQNNPVGFCEEVLNEKLTSDIKDALRILATNPVVFVRSANAVGKTHAMARVAIWFFKCFEDAQVYTTAAPPYENLKKLLWGEIEKVLAKNKKVFADDQITQLEIKSGGSFITGVSIPATGTKADREAKFSGKHSKNLMFIVDEGDAVPEEIYKAIESSMSGGNSKLVVTFNPRAKRGITYKMERDKLARVVEVSAFTHPNVMTGEDLIPGAVTRQKTVERILKWTRPLAKNELEDNRCFTLPDFLVGSTVKLPTGEISEPLKAGIYVIVESAFYYMVLGRYPAQAEQQLISYDDINRARLRWDAYVATYGETAPRNVEAIAGLDVAEYGADYTVLIKRYGGFVMTPEMWGGVDPDTSAIKAASKVGSIHTFVDSTGVGSGVPARMNRLDASAEGVKVSSKPTYADEELGEFAIMRDQLWWSIREWLRLDNTAMLPPDEELIEELVIPTYSTDTGKIQVMKKDVMKDLLGRSPNKADALGLTFAPMSTVRMGYA